MAVSFFRAAPHPETIFIRKVINFGLSTFGSNDLFFSLSYFDIAPKSQDECFT